MNVRNKHSLNLSPLNECKDTQNQRFKAQMKRVFKAFSEKPKTMLQVSIETDVLRANICRYVAEWRKIDKIGVSFYGACPLSKHKAGFYTTDSTKFLKDGRQG